MPTENKSKSEIRADKEQVLLAFKKQARESLERGEDIVLLDGPSLLPMFKLFEISFPGNCAHYVRKEKCDFPYPAQDIQAADVNSLREILLEAARSFKQEKKGWTS